MIQPIKHCYWVSPSELLAGEYPRNEDEESSTEKINALIQAGITVFIDLTQKNDGLLPYSAMLDENTIHQRFPIQDVSIPDSVEVTKAILDTIDHHISQGKIVYLHCWGGVGRTGTIVGCWLARHGQEGRASLDRLQELWKQCPKSDHRNVNDSEEQKQYILEWREPKVTPLMRYQGCMLGLAVGDAVGTTVEFKAPGTFSPVKDMVGGGPFGLKPGQWTDDTSMALCLAESLINCQDFDADDQIKRYVRWWKEGYLSSTGRCFDIGNTVSQALLRYQKTGEPFAGSIDAFSAGNGSLMRLAPIPLFFASDPEKAINMSAESSKTTHGARSCLDACRYFGGLIVGALQGISKRELLSSRYTPVEGLWNRMPLCDEVDAIAWGSFKHKDPPLIVGSGYVVKSLEAALWAFHRTLTFKDGLLLAVNLGDDADTTGAIYGQIAGAYYGVADIPSAWLERIAYRNRIDEISREIFDKKKSRTSSYQEMDNKL
jgi:ADP-ribosylglycohydrolase/protein-tyrosine phosphatase